jgi:hypothetical protein
MFVLTNDAQRVGVFCAERIGNTAGWAPTATGIGLDRNGVIIAGVMYDRYTGPNVVAHIAGVPGSRWMTRNFLRAIFQYPFLGLEVKRLTAEVEVANAAAMRLNKHFGFQYEATLTDVFPSGDVDIMVMWKQDCRWLHI